MLDQDQEMPSSNTTAHGQADAGKLLTFSPPAVELQARRLRRRFGLAPATAAVVAGLAYAAEARP
jgi:hypothetical protein